MCDTRIAKQRRSLVTAAAPLNENSCCRSPPRSAIAQTARHPSVDITDTTPAHTAATLRPDRHHTHGLHTTISGWRLYEAYGEQSFVAISMAISSCPGRPMSENYTIVWRTENMLLRAPIYLELHGSAHSRRIYQQKQCELFAPPDDTNG